MLAYSRGTRGEQATLAHRGLDGQACSTRPGLGHGRRPAPVATASRHCHATVKRDRKEIQSLYHLCVLPANRILSTVEPRRFEPLTFVVQRRYDTLPELSGACKIPAKGQLFPSCLSCVFRLFTQVAAQTLRPTTAQEPARSLLVYLPEGHLCGRREIKTPKFSG